MIKGSGSGAGAWSWIWIWIWIRISAMCCSITLVVFIVLCWVQALFSWSVFIVSSYKFMCAFSCDCDWLFRLRAEVKCSSRWPIGKREYAHIQGQVNTQTFDGSQLFWAISGSIWVPIPLFSSPLCTIKSNCMFIPIIAWSSSQHSVLGLYFKTFKEPRNRFQGIDSASLCSLAGRYGNPSRFL